MASTKEEKLADAQRLTDELRAGLTKYALDPNVGRELFDELLDKAEKLIALEAR